MTVNSWIIRDWIRGNIRNVHESNEVAEHFGVSLEALRKAFVRSEGCSLGRFIREEKLKKARELLRNSNYRCFEICEKLGLGQPQNVSRAFKRRFEITITAYRSQFKRKMRSHTHHANKHPASSFDRQLGKRRLSGNDNQK
jgi:AraC family multidrug resistance transcriptional activator